MGSNLVDADTNSLEVRDKHVRSRVSFNNKVRVILIPSRPEYHDLKLAEDLWWSDFDYATFKKSLEFQVKFISAVKNVDGREALKQIL